MISDLLNDASSVAKVMWVN